MLSNVQPSTKSSALSTLLRLEDGVIPQEVGERNLEHYLREEYNTRSGGWKLKAYYFLRPAIPRRVQLALRRKYLAVQSERQFPDWPVESVLVDRIAGSLTRAVESRNGEDLHRISVWPSDNKFAFVITHDVEWDSGLRTAPRLAKLENDLGFISSWNIVPERYPIDWEIVDRLRSDGFEIGVHGLKHDGKLFQNHRLFQQRLVKIHQYAAEWGASGFRSPSTMRNVEWMPELKFEYDSSFPDTDPYEPQPGGCCSIWPYFISNLLELPMTMPQDHTLFEILQHNDISVWKNKADWIESKGGMVLINIHPDYMATDDRLKFYEEFLRYMRGKKQMWHALPRDVARWWKDRAASSLIRANGAIHVEGPASSRARIIQTQLLNGILCDKYVTN